MKNTAMKKRLLRSCAYCLVCVGIGTALLSISAESLARAPSPSTPALTISNDPLPPALRNQIYSRPSVAPHIDARQISGAAYYGTAGEQTIVGRKVGTLVNQLSSLQSDVSSLSAQLVELQRTGQAQAAEYYASVATISTQLQSGTTPGNPRLINRLDIARDNLERLSGNISRLNNLAVSVSGAASVSAYLLESTRATYGLSGAIEEDHARLAQLEDSINSTVVIIDRLLNNVNDDITRTNAYLASERDNLRTLALAINTGGMFGKSLSNRPFSNVRQSGFTPAAASSYGIPNGMSEDASSYHRPVSMHGGVPGGPRPLVKIRFDRPNVSYQQPMYMAVNEALKKYPSARFELVAVHPSTGNAAEVAIESTKSRRNAERVLRTLTEMGLSTDKVDLSYTPSAQATTNEVHLYVH